LEKIGSSDRFSSFLKVRLKIARALERTLTRDNPTDCRAKSKIGGKNKMGTIAETITINNADFYLNSDTRENLIAQLNDMKMKCQQRKAANIKRAKFYQRIHYITGSFITFFSLLSILLTFFDNKMFIVFSNILVVFFMSIITFFRPENIYEKGKKYVASISALMEKIELVLYAVSYRGTDFVKEEILAINKELSRLILKSDVLSSKNYETEEMKNEK
jgi:hypothetical protein